MVKRPLKLREKTPSDGDADSAAADSHSAAAEPQRPEPEIHGKQKRREELGRYWLQVDRQTKGSYASVEEAEAAGMAIKSKFTQVQVAIYDRDESSNRILQAPE